MGKKKEGYVVDNNLKVHGIKNLFICDNSIQKYTGNSNPTFTLVIFALRLSNFLKKLLSDKKF
jgi:choline dehydrogenase-like flavoprotein